MLTTLRLLLFLMMLYVLDDRPVVAQTSARIVMSRTALTASQPLAPPDEGGRDDGAPSGASPMLPDSAHGFECGVVRAGSADWRLERGTTFH